MGWPLSSPPGNGSWFSSMTGEVGEFIALGAHSYGTDEIKDLQYKGQVAEILIFDPALNALERVTIAK
jgi:hypothetical protein